MQVKKQVIFAVAITTLLATSVAFASEGLSGGQWKYSTSVDYSSGDYGGDPDDTDITYIPFTTSYTRDQWTFKATVPWVQIDGPGTVIGAGDGGVIVDPDDTEVTKESGLGDIWLTAKYAVEAVPAELFYLDVGAKLKLPTADEDKRLGTGEVDYTLQAEIFKPIDAFTPFATLAYKIKGDPDEVNLKNVFYLSVGSDYRLSETRHIGASLDFQEASTSGSDDATELFVYVSQRMNSQWSVTLYGYKGLQDGSPDYGAGLQLSYKP